MNDLEEDELPTWELRSGEGLLATIKVADQDFPWMSGHITPTESFEPLRHLFVVHPDRETLDACRGEIRRLGIVLQPSGGRPVRHFVLQVDGIKADFKFA